MLFLKQIHYFIRQAIAKHVLFAVLCHKMTGKCSTKGMGVFSGYDNEQSI